jgi:hypothetical protein
LTIHIPVCIWTARNVEFVVEMCSIEDSHGLDRTSTEGLSVLNAAVGAVRLIG